MAHLDNLGLHNRQSSVGFDTDTVADSEWNNPFGDAESDTNDEDDEDDEYMATTLAGEIVDGEGKDVADLDVLTSKRVSPRPHFSSA